MTDPLSPAVVVQRLSVEVHPAARSNPTSCPALVMGGQAPLVLLHDASLWQQS